MLCMALSQAPVMKPLRVSSVDVSDDKLSGMLGSLGIVKDASIEVISRDRSGGTIIMVKGSKLALDKNLSGAIKVE